MTLHNNRLIQAVAAIILLMAATDAAAQFRWGPTAGLTLTNLNFKQDLLPVSQVTGGSGGVQIEMMFPGVGFGFDTGLIYELRGADIDWGAKKMWASQGMGKERLYLHYVDIPLHLRFKYTRLGGVEDYVAPLVFGGPSFGLMMGHSTNKALKYAFGEVGLAAGIGVELYKRWQITASYTWGMTYAMKAKTLTNYSAQNRTWDFRVSYFF